MPIEVSGVYGFAFTKPLTTADYKLLPIFSQHNDAESKASSKHELNLTGFSVWNRAAVGAEDWKRLGDALTFCEQQTVHVSKPCPVSETDSHAAESLQAKFPNRISLGHSRETCGPLVARDWLNPDSRRDFLDLLSRKMVDSAFLDATHFHLGFYRNVEGWRLNHRFDDILFYMAFSGLELLARRSLSDYTTRNVGEVLAKHLKGFGFAVTQQEMEDYSQLRNAIFHNGQLSCVLKRNGEEISTSSIPDLEILLVDVLLKTLGFDDQTINWNRWKDRMPFK